MNQITPFNFEGHQVRTIERENIIWFAMPDISKSLGLSNSSVAIKSLDNDEVTKFNLGGLSGNTNFISEPGLYKLIGASRKPEAKRFNRWVTHDVLPSIRKNGVYMTDEKAYDVTHNPNGLADLLMQAGEQLKHKDLVIKELQPKALFADAVATSDTSILVGELAKLLKQNGINVGQNRLFAWLRDNGYLIAAKRADRNMPTQRSLEHGWFEIKERSFANPDGSIRVTKTPKVTGKGQQYFINKFLSINLIS
ncbi:phage antirepressor [Lactiplantibacillus pentosus]|jgi:anti-repressor protein|uniref:phage antirepressor n=2 Tax=Lactiplantibacillus TaxID=2767842 RepID=UPI0021824B91|nr:phage antirepressor KilAC domain-containing protein [Lactiplantibacillus pentosus]MCS8603743.1 phage repressor protein/antirepressor Ant [Lactiplantibacillus pentosus]MCT3285806.1 phage repressor protein/antirepressor Ant [Lactiplantibacillus pentosus]